MTIPVSKTPPEDAATTIRDRCWYKTLASTGSLAGCLVIYLLGAVSIVTKSLATTTLFLILLGIAFGCLIVEARAVAKRSSEIRELRDRVRSAYADRDLASKPTTEHRDDAESDEALRARHRARRRDRSSKRESDR